MPVDAAADTKGDATAADCNTGGKVTGVFGGSFNPVHNGHIALAREVVRQRLADRVLMVLSPLNPLKEHPEALIDDGQRMEMLRLACAPYPELIPCDIELTMSRPSYTVDTLRRLADENPDGRFRLIIGADNWMNFDRWREPVEIITRFSPIIYPRENCQLPVGDPRVTAISAPLFPVSSTAIRELIAAGDDVNNLMPQTVLDYIRARKLYGSPDTL